jgi:hypothetical protein
MQNHRPERHRLPGMVVAVGLCAGLAQAQNARVIRNTLWDPASPCCILEYNPGGGRLELPPPYRIPTFEESLGAGAYEGMPMDFLPATPVGPRQTVIQAGSSAITITITYADGASEGFNDPTLGTARRDAFEFAASLWTGVIDGPANISVQATFTPNGGTAGSATLASAGPGQFWDNFSGQPVANTWYPEPLVEVLSGSDPDNGVFDIGVDCNSDVDGPVVLGSTTFYYGTDGNPGSDMDFVSIIVHELGHGWGIVGSFTADGSSEIGASGNPLIYDRFLVDGSGTTLISQPASASLVTGNNVFWNGAGALGAYQTDFGGTGNVPIFAPTPYNPGSSISHLDESTFSGVWALMTPQIGFGEVANIVDDIVLGMLRDMGYGVSFDAIYVDGSYVGIETGEPTSPFNTVLDGMNQAFLNSGGRVLVKPGVYPEAPVVLGFPAFTFPITVLPWGPGTVRIE